MQIREMLIKTKEKINTRIGIRKKDNALEHRKDRGERIPEMERYILARSYFLFLIILMAS